MTAMATVSKKSVVSNGWTWLKESTFGLVFLTVASLAVVGFVLPVIATTIVNATAEGYTGKAVIQEHTVIGSLCNIQVLKEDGTIENLVAGPRAACGNIEDGITITMKDGNIKN